MKFHVWLIICLERDGNDNEAAYVDDIEVTYSALYAQQKAYQLNSARDPETYYPYYQVVPAFIDTDSR